MIIHTEYIQHVFSPLHFYSLDVSFQLSKANYRAMEGTDDFVSLRISKEAGVFIANPVEFRVTPLTIKQALDQGVIPTFENETANSPNRAGYKCIILTITNNVDKFLPYR